MAKTRLKISEEEKKKRRREQKKMYMRRKREQLKKDPIAMQEVQRKDRERHRKMKEEGKKKTIKDYTPREQRRIRTYWRKEAQKHRAKKAEQKKIQAMLNDNTPPSSSAATIVSSSNRNIAARNRRLLRAENIALKDRLHILERKLSKYRMRLLRNKCTKSRVQVYKEASENRFKVAKKKIQEFLEKDENSRITSGKKETITKKKQKKQIRLLNSTMLDLYEKFKKEYDVHVSYAFFCRYRPFWIINPSAHKRNTCLCLTHVNMELLVKSAFNGNIIKENTLLGLVKSMCCDGSFKNSCLERSCESCRSQKLHINTVVDSKDKICYERWATKKVMVIVKGKEKICQKTVKESIVTNIHSMVQLLQKMLLNFMRHICNIYHQHRSIQNIKGNILENEAMLHIDFSENYNCKYAEEVQSAHFGGSKPQITLHTSVLYYREPVNKTVVAKSYCTLSPNLKHDPVMICAHLKPVLQDIRILVPNLSKMHFLSDGPTTQYRNKSMFCLIAKYLGPSFGLDSIKWHFSEAGHGKGAPDGVGGYLKRTADRCVALGKDVSDYDSLFSCLKENCKSVTLMSVDDQNMNDINSAMDRAIVKPFKGTMKIHEIVWDRKYENKLRARRLTCLQCSSDSKCSHFELGQINITEKRPDTPDTDIDINHGFPFPLRSAKTAKRKILVSEVYSDDSADSDRITDIEHAKMQQDVPTTSRGIVGTTHRITNRLHNFFCDSSDEEDSADSDRNTDVEHAKMQQNTPTTSRGIVGTTHRITNDLNNFLCDSSDEDIF